MNNIKQSLDLSHLIDDPNFDPEQLGARFWYEQFLKLRAENQQQQLEIQRQQLEIQQLHAQLSQLQAEVDQLKEALRKVSQRKGRYQQQATESSIQEHKDTELNVLIVWLHAKMSRKSPCSRRKSSSRGLSSQRSWIDFSPKPNLFWACRIKRNE